jgi:serine/threonine protein phosphatase PrpC
VIGAKGEAWRGNHKRCLTEPNQQPLKKQPLDKNGGESVMVFKTACHTDKGIIKKSNQDALLMKTATTPDGQVGLFLICDGMGGLSHGELASATVVQFLSEWFDHKLPDILQAGSTEETLPAELESAIQTVNSKILAYGEKNKVKLGTTMTALLVVYSNYYIVQIGDSRAYLLNRNGSLTQLTKDQTLVARELEQGNITAEQAAADSRRNVLLQCVGASPDLQPVFTGGKVEKGHAFMLCSDGFYHEINEEEIKKALESAGSADEESLKILIESLIEKVKARKEKDNISVILTQVT